MHRQTTCTIHFSARQRRVKLFLNAVMRIISWWQCKSLPYQSVAKRLTTTLCHCYEAFSGHRSKSTNQTVPCNSTYPISECSHYVISHSLLDANLLMSLPQPPLERQHSVKHDGEKQQLYKATVVWRDSCTATCEQVFDLCEVTQLQAALLQEALLKTAVLQAVLLQVHVDTCSPRR